MRGGKQLHGTTRGLDSTENSSGFVRIKEGIHVRTECSSFVWETPKHSLLCCFRAMNLVGRSLALGWMTTVLVVQVSAARHSRWALNAKTQALWDLSPQELECVHNFLMNRRELELQSSKELTLAKNSVFLIEMLKPRSMRYWIS